MKHLKFLLLFIGIFIIGCKGKNPPQKLISDKCDPKTESMSHPIDIENGIRNLQKHDDFKGIGIIESPTESFYYFIGNEPINFLDGDQYPLISFQMILPDSTLKDSIPTDRNFAIFFNSFELDSIPKVIPLSIKGRGAHGCIPSPAVIRSGGSYKMKTYNIGGKYWIPLPVISHSSGSANLEYFVTSNISKVIAINTFVNKYNGDIEIGLDKAPQLSRGGLLIQKHMILYHKKLDCLTVES